MTEKHAEPLEQADLDEHEADADQHEVRRAAHREPSTDIVQRIPQRKHDGGEDEEQRHHEEPRQRGGREEVSFADPGRDLGEPDRKDLGEWQLIEEEGPVVGRRRHVEAKASREAVEVGAVREVDDTVQRLGRRFPTRHDQGLELQPIDGRREALQLGLREGRP